jgi:outer membrane receptor protein involved in Fe transport
VPCATAAGTCAYDPTARYNLDGNNNAFTGRAALSYKWDSGMLAYVSYNRGYRSGAFNGGSYTSSAGINFVKPETVNAYEVGLKGRALDRTLSFSTAAFYYDYSNQQLQDTRPGPVSILVNAPKSEIYGAEGEFTWTPSNRFSINGSIGLLHAKYKELTLQGTNLAGNDLPFAPHVTAQIGADVVLLDSGVDRVTLSPNVAYAGHQYFTPFNLTNAAGTAEQCRVAAGRQCQGERPDHLAARQPATARVDQECLQRPHLCLWAGSARAGFPYNFLVQSAPRTFGASAKVTF